MDNILNIVMSFRIADIIDIILVSIIFYKLLILIRETRAEQIIKGLIVLLVVFNISKFFQLHMIQYILENTLTVGVIALLVVFQPELRRALEYIGRTKVISGAMTEIVKEETKEYIEEIIKACVIFSGKKTGALIVIERETGLNEIVSTGTLIDGKISTPLLTNLFEHNAPLHDGAVLIKKDRLMAAGCFLPLSTNYDISKELGTRHRAALGMSENSDAIVIVVSEETGGISIAMDSSLKRFLDEKSLRKILYKLLLNKKEKSLVHKWRLLNAKKLKK